ncbi:MAG TPA: lysozyme inhibitor LprI family protein [Candidatus Dormibacteraeota bacterium]|jgi:uncharacterized protein YecT (DUF1311 family)|nr:lysozyme inhibitor LprI family protein [Candidatus Dormibacteraeota bacterium]
MKKNWAIVLFLIFSGTVFSRTLFAQCEKAGTTADTTRCMSNEYDKADAELNRIYKLTFKGLEVKESDNLKKAQRVWIIYRDAQCDAEYAKWGGGTGGPAAHLGCLFRLTQLRTRELHKTYRFQ